MWRFAAVLMVSLTVRLLLLQGDRMWRFAAGLYLVYLAGGELQLAAVFGFTAGGAIMLFGGIIGNWVDINSRLKG